MTDTKKFIGLFLILLQFSQFVSAADSLNVKGFKPGQMKRKAKGAVKQHDYGSAVYYYERYLDRRTPKQKMMFTIAESYRNYRDYKKAEEWYLKSFEGSKNEHALSLYYYALMQKMNGNYKMAVDNFKKFKKMSSGDSELKPYVARLKADIAGCDTAKKMMESPKKVLLFHMDTSVNKVHFEGSPVPLSDTTLLYASLRTNKKEYTVAEGTDDSPDAPVRKLYVAKKVNDKWIYKNEFEGPFNQAGVNASNGAFSTDGKRFYFTRCKRDRKGKMICSIYVSENENGQWNEPKPLPEIVNNPKYTSTQPAVAIEAVKKNEVIYFVSDMPGGKGGMDIWYTIYDLKKNTYRKPKNVGTKVNTPQDEMTPYYNTDKRTMYFSSDGWAGLGGLDIFQARGELSKYTNPVNAGYPVNSSADDLYYAEGKNKEEGFFVSNRVGGVARKNATCCDDLYSFNKLDYVRITLKGSVIEKDSLKTMAVKRATLLIYIKDANEISPVFIKSVEANDQGKYSVDLEQGVDYKLQVTKEGYFNTESELSTKSYIKSQGIETQHELKIMPKAPIVLKNIYYNTDKADLLPTALASIDSVLLKALNENPTIKVEISSHTDSQGSDTYNQTLSQKRAESVVNYLISKGVNKERLVAMGYGESQPIAPNKKTDGTDDPVGMEKNRRTEFRIIGVIPHTEIEYED